VLYVTSQSHLGFVVSEAVGGVNRAIDKALGGIALSATGITGSASGSFVNCVVVSAIWASFIGQHAGSINELLEGSVGELRVGAGNDAVTGFADRTGRAICAVLATNWAVAVSLHRENGC
jgi:hypothetical protein